MRVFSVKFPAAFDAVFVTINEKSVPAKIKYKVRTIAVYPIIGANFNKRLVIHPNNRKDEQQYAIFFKLRENPETGIFQFGMVFVSCTILIIMKQLALPYLSGWLKPVSDFQYQETIF